MNGTIHALLVLKNNATKEIIKAHAETTDGSLNKFINRAIDETIERDNKKD